jgi:hypothetical protein
VIRSDLHQDPNTGRVLVVFAAAPGKAPPDDCCFRVTNMNNTLQFTPVGKGVIEVEYVMNMNMGGFMPDVFLNYMQPRVVYSVLRTLQPQLSKAKYQTTKLDFIVEK